jgi:hypothetical protein
MRWGLFVLLWLAALAAGRAEEPAAPSPPDKEAGSPEAGEVQTVYQKTTLLDFSDVTILGELAKPEGSYIMNKKRAHFDLLIRVRDNFLPEIIKTVDHL